MGVRRIHRNSMGGGVVMARTPTPIKTADVTRMIHAARKAGVEVGAVEFDLLTGRISIKAASEPAPNDAEAAAREWFAKNAG
jgi:hypothetical protein